MYIYICCFAGFSKQWQPLIVKVYIYIGMEHVFCYMCLPTIFVRKYKVKKLVTDLGWNAVEGSLLTDDAIRREVPPLTHYFDPMHVFFVQGQFSRHVGLLLKALKKMGWTPDSIAEACTNDSIRHRSSTRKVARAQFARELGDAYFTEDGIWKVSASSQLGAAPLLHFLIRFVVFPTITCPDLKKELQAFLLLGSVLSLARWKPSSTLKSATAALLESMDLSSAEASFVKFVLGSEAAAMDRPLRSLSTVINDLRKRR